MRPAWSSQQDPRQPGLYRETLSQHTKKTYSTFKRKRHLMSKQPGIRFAKCVKSKCPHHYKEGITNVFLEPPDILSHCTVKSLLLLQVYSKHILHSDPYIGKKSYLIQEIVWDIFIFLNFQSSIYNTHWVYFSPGPYLIFSHSFPLLLVPFIPLVSFTSSFMTYTHELHINIKSSEFSE